MTFDAKEYYLKNRERILQKNLEYRQKNKERVTEMKREYYQKNKETIRIKESEYKKEYYARKIAKNPDYYKELHSTIVSRKNSDKNVFARHKFSDQKSSAKIRKIEWNLDKDSTIKLIAEAKYCAISGIRLSHKINNRHAPSIDRINSSRGYVPGNIQIVSTIVNRMKNVLTSREFKEICKKVVQNEK